MKVTTVALLVVAMVLVSQVAAIPTVNSQKRALRSL